jgi:replicative DNA helicase
MADVFDNEDVRESLATYEGEDEIISSLDMLEQIANMPPVYPIYCGMNTVDEWCEGFIDGELILLGGKPKSGKSLLQRTFISNFCKQGKPPIVFTFEEQPRQFLKNFDNGAEDIMFYMPKKLTAGNVDWVLEKMMEAKLKKGTRIAFIDHGQYLYEMSDDVGTKEISGVGRKLKTFAVNNDFIIFVIWHITKERVDSIDDLDQSSLRDSGMLAGECDMIFFTFRGVKSSGVSQIEESYLKIEVTRRSGVWKRVIPIRKHGGRFVEAGIDF